jgi:hypothetical protein
MDRLGRIFHVRRHGPKRIETVTVDPTTTSTEDNASPAVETSTDGASTVTTPSATVTPPVATTPPPTPAPGPASHDPAAELYAGWTEAERFIMTALEGAVVNSRQRIDGVVADVAKVKTVIDDIVSKAQSVDPNVVEQVKTLAAAAEAHDTAIKVLVEQVQSHERLIGTFVEAFKVIAGAS